jgi:hypothetical protein
MYKHTLQRIFQKGRANCTVHEIIVGSKFWCELCPSVEMVLYRRQIQMGSRTDADSYAQTNELGEGLKLMQRARDGLFISTGLWKNECDRREREVRLQRFLCFCAICGVPFVAKARVRMFARQPVYLCGELHVLYTEKRVPVRPLYA